MNRITHFRKSVSRRLRHWAKTVVGARPWLFFPISCPRPEFDDLLVTRSTDLCIEGFPRSGNSFAVGAVEHAQSEPIRIAHHTHVPANAMRACEWAVPTLVLIREPKHAVVSGVALTKHVQKKEHSAENPVQWVSFLDHVWAWNTFYQSLMPYRDEFLLTTLGDVVENMGKVIDRVNDRFGTDFDRFEHTPEATAEVHADRGYHAGPSEQRDRLKADTQDDFDAQLQSDPSLRHTLEKANSLYDALTSKREAKYQ